MLPFFVIGSERSGTSYLASLLGGHDSYVAPPECQFKKELLNARFHNSSLTRNQVLEAWDIVRNNFRFRLWGISLDIEEYLSVEGKYQISGLLYWIVRSYARERHRKENVEVWFDHDPSTRSYPEKILEAFPEARFIHIIRDGRGVYASFKGVDWGPNTPNEGAVYWKEGIEEGMEVERSLGEERCIRVYYEELLEDPKGVLKRICDWGGLTYKEQMLEGKGFIPPDYTRQQHRFVRTGPKLDKAGGWRRSLSNREIELFERAAGDHLENLGYERCFSQPRPMNWLERIWYRRKEGILKRMNDRKRRKRKAWGLQKAKEAERSG